MQNFIGSRDLRGGNRVFGRVRRRIGLVGRRWDNAYGYRGDGLADDSVGGDERDAKFHGDGDER